MKHLVSNLGSSNRTTILATGETIKNETVATIERHDNGDATLIVPKTRNRSTTYEKVTAEGFAAAVKARIKDLEATDAENLKRRAMTTQAWNDVVAMLEPEQA